jgi:hypothetical protein
VLPCNGMYTCARERVYIGARDGVEGKADWEGRLMTVCERGRVHWGGRKVSREGGGRQGERKSVCVCGGGGWGWYFFIN